MPTLKLKPTRHGAANCYDWCMLFGELARERADFVRLVAEQKTRATFWDGKASTYGHTIDIP